MSPRERELLLGNLVTWGCIVSAVVLAIAFVPLLASETENNGFTSSVDAHLIDTSSTQG